MSKAYNLKLKLSCDCFSNFSSLKMALVNELWILLLFSDEKYSYSVILNKM